MARFAAALAFFHPEIEALTFPAWDCLPYDRVSPNGEIVSRRIDTLTRLATAPPDKLVVLTTVNALVQRVPPRRLFDGRVLTLRTGGRVGLDRLQSFFRNNGYIRTDTVRESGEFAIRGGIVDLYPAGAAEPLRLDFFRRHARNGSQLRPADPAVNREARRGGIAAGQRGLARRRCGAPLPLALPRAVRRDRHRRPALRIGQRRAALSRHGALAAALLRAAGNLIRLSARRRDLARLPGGGGARPPARSDRRFLRGAPQRHARGARRCADLSPDTARPALPRPPRVAGGVAWPAGRAAVAFRGGSERRRRLRCRRPPGAQLRRRARRPEYRAVRGGARLPRSRAQIRPQDRGRRIQRRARPTVS